MILNIYLPEDKKKLKETLEKEAQKRGWSLSQYIIWLLEKRKEKK